MARKPPGLFITGTDTGVGKTYVAALIARALCEQRHTVGVYKPVATGCRLNAAGAATAAKSMRKSSDAWRGSLVCDDAIRLYDSAGRPGELARVCPQAFKAPLAPHLAAAQEGRRIDAELLRTGVRYWQKRSDFVLVEGAGGLMSPVSEDEYNADVAYDLGYPLVVVVENRIGAINQALQTLIAAATFKEGLPVAGLALNRTSKGGTSDPSTATNRRELAARCVPPILAELAFGAARFDPPIDWVAVARAK
jgi:dethiobiotin synthetase